MKIEGNKLYYFDDLYEAAKAFQKTSKDEYDRCRSQYEGDRYSDEGARFKAIRPLSYELVEAQVSTTIPPIRCDAERYSQGRQRNALTLEKTIMQDLQKAYIDRLNDEDERTTYIYGSSVWLIEWDDTIIKHGEVGAPVLTLIRPDRFIPQPGVAAVQRCEYVFIDFETTVQEASRKYDVSEETLRKAHTPREGDKDGYIGDENGMTVHICYYRDADGKISEYVWTDEVELMDLADIYSRRRSVCKICGRSGALSEDGETCACGGEIIDMPAEYEELTKDIVLDAGNVVKVRRVIPALSPVIKNGQLDTEKKFEPIIGGDGIPLTEDIDGMQMPMMAEQEVPKMRPTRIPWYTPDLLPIVVRKNTSTEASIFGQSDLTYIRDIQMEYNKIKSRVYEKLIGSTVFPVVPERAEFHIDNTINQKVCQVPEGMAMNQFGAIDTSVNIAQDMAYLNQLYDEAQRTLGITDSYLGAADTTAQSGKAKQIQVNQAAGRLESKRSMKQVAYAEIANIIFQYRLAYSDEPVPVKSTDEFGMVHFGSFNRYDYVEYDVETGEWYYDDRYLFRVDPVANNEDDPETVWQTVLNGFGTGLYGNPADISTMLRVWLMLERSHYPYASEQVTYLQGMLMQQKAMAMQGMPGGEMQTPNPMPTANGAQPAKVNNNSAVKGGVGNGASNQA